MAVRRNSTSSDGGALMYMRTSSSDTRKDVVESQTNIAAAIHSFTQDVQAIEYDDTDDQLQDSNWRNPWDWLLHDFLHDYSALWFLAVHISMFFLCIFFAPMTIPLKHATRKTLQAALVTDGDKGEVDPTEYLNLDLSHLKSIRNILCFTFALILTYTVSLIVVLSVRYMVIKLLVQPLYNISHLAIVVTYAIDPAAAYCIWTVINYAIFRKFTKPVHGEFGSRLHRFILFGNRISKFLEIDGRCYNWTNSICHLQILITTRKLVLSSLLFLFEITFLPNYSSELKCFLKDQALFRKFNVAWLNVVNKARESEHPEMMQRVEEARAAIERIPLPDTPIIYDHHVYYATENFKIFRPTIHGWYRRKHQLGFDINHKVKEVPQFYKESWIKKCSSDFLTNWSALHYMVHHPPELLFMDYYVPLTSKNTVQDYSRLLFDHIYETMNAINQNAAITRQPSPRKEGCILRPELMFSRSCRLNLDQSNYPLNSRQSGRFTAEPLSARRARSTVHFSRILTDAPDSDSGDEVPSKNIIYVRTRQAHTVHEDRRRLTPKMFSCLNSPVVDAFFAEYDIGNCGYISSNVFMRNVLYMCSIRKRLMSTLKNQRSILCLVGRLVSTMLWFLIFVIFLMTFRVNKNIVLPSTIGFLSAMIVALSYMYTSFITAIIFVVLSNPYNVGDRIRINDGEAMYVKSITTYNTKFRCIHGKVITYQNSILSTLNITNETRARHAAHELVLRVGANTTPAALKQLIENMKSYVNGRPRKFVKDGCYIYRSEVQVGHYYLLNVVLTYLENWSTPNQIFALKNEFILQLSKQCNMLGITYKQPIEPVSFCNALNYSGMSSFFNMFNLDSEHGTKITQPAPAPPPKE